MRRILERFARSIGRGGCLVLLGLTLLSGLYGWMYQPYARDPFMPGPGPLEGLAWWTEPQGHPELATMPVIPVGRDWVRRENLAAATATAGEGETLRIARGAATIGPPNSERRAVTALSVVGEHGWAIDDQGRAYQKAGAGAPWLALSEPKIGDPGADNVIQTPSQI